ncbi:MAG: tyrosine--tRNA ligase [Clostridia bacterium]|nr:tyrosine--tRNA ligase [Clostridia bacterium]
MNYNLIPDNVSEHTNVYDVLRERGFIEQTTDDEGIRDLLGKEKIKFYIGFDPTADCLHVGHFMQVIIMMYMQKYGHTPVVLIGGGTTMIGDPSGRSDMRQMMTQETIRENGIQFKHLFDRFLEFDEDWQYTPSGSVLGKGSYNKEPEPGKAICVNNADWLLGFNYLEFIRDIGSKFNVNSMLRAECFKQRMAKEGGLTFLEFNYMLLQSYDFYCLARDIDCKIQFGGNDQWSNILFGADLSRKILGKDSYYGMTFALLTNSEGKKMGKTQSGALWLSPEKTSPYEFYQYWRNVGDADVEKCLRMLTFLPMDEVKRLASLEGSEINKAKEVLAYEVTKLVHGEEEAVKAQEAARAAFGGGAAGMADLPEIEIAAADLNSTDKEGNELGGLGVAAFLKTLGLAGSNRDAMDVIKQGGLKLDGEKVTDPKTLITPESFTDGKMLVEKGKKKKIMAKLV